MNNFLLLKRYRLLLLWLGMGLLSGCGAVHTSVAKKDLDVQTKMTESIFLDPVPAEQRIVYVRVRNTSDKPGLALELAIKQGIINNGYRITDNPDEAHFWLQANVLKAGRVDKHNPNAGGDAVATGAVLGSTTGRGDGRIAMAVAGALLATMIDASVKDTYYTIITDVQISERAKGDVKVTEATQSSLTQGTSGKKMSSSVEDVRWKRYQTRIVSVANKVNLTFEEAERPLIDGLVRSVANVF